MGLTLDCACVFCGYDQKGILLGSEMILGYHYFPAYQPLEKKLVQVNIFRYLEIEEFRLPGEPNMEQTIFKSIRLYPYFEESMFEKNEKENEILSDFPYLQAKYNYCPQCANFKLEFKVAKLFY
jgi:hypothetical protein